MVHPARVGVKLVPLYFNALLLFEYAGQKLLGVEDLVAAPERPDPGELIIEGLNAGAHGIGEVEYPGLGAALPDLSGKELINGHGAHGPEDPAGTGGISHRLVDPVFLRGVNVAAHLPEGTGKDGDDDKVRPGQGLVDTGAHLILEDRAGLGIAVNMPADSPVALRGGQIDVIEAHFPAQALGQSQVGHEYPGPLLGTAADVGDVHAFCHAKASAPGKRAMREDRVFFSSSFSARIGLEGVL